MRAAIKPFTQVHVPTSFSQISETETSRFDVVEAPGDSQRLRRVAFAGASGPRNRCGGKNLRLPAWRVHREILRNALARPEQLPGAERFHVYSASESALRIRPPAYVDGRA
jgi:hypothetical protein